MKLRLVQKFNVGAVEKYPSRVFLSVLPREEGGFVGVVREYDPEEGNTRTEIRLLTFDARGFVNSDQYLVDGEDPRLFRWGEKLFVLTWLETRRGDWYLWLVNVTANSKVQLKIEPWMFHGKNWAPVVVEDRLYVLRSLDPLVVLEVDAATGVCGVVHGPDRQREIGQYRGGGAAHFRDGIISGFGHRTHHQELHTVFHYSINARTWEVRREEVEVIGAEGMGIVDPTSSWARFCACCCTRSFWWRWQPVMHGVFEVEEG